VRTNEEAINSYRDGVECGSVGLPADSLMIVHPP
jgi:hypothetical protein